MTDIILPELGVGITKAVIACWHVKVGDSVKAGDEALEVVTDKATFSVDVPISGILKSILVTEGQEGAVGAVLGRIE